MDTKGDVRHPGSVRADRKLLEMLVCPLTQMTLRFDDEAGELVSTSARLAYPIRDGIPILAPDEARDIDTPKA